MAKQKLNYNKLKKIFNCLDKDKKTLAEPLLKKFEFMDKSLDALMEDIIENGLIVTEINGNGFAVTKANPAKTEYDKMYKNYAATWSKLVDLLPKSEQNSNELLDFITKNDK